MRVVGKVILELNICTDINSTVSVSASRSHFLFFMELPYVANLELQLRPQPFDYVCLLVPYLFLIR
jgi:hypothetical protein